MSPEEAQVTIQLVTPAAYNSAPLWRACDENNTVEFRYFEEGDGKLEVVARALLERRS